MKYNRATQQQMREQIESYFVVNPEIKVQSRRNELMDEFLRGELSASEFIRLSDSEVKPKLFKPTTEFIEYL